MKVVFLDVDGVLNYDGCRVRVKGFTGVDDVLVSRLAEIVHATDAQIVLTSSWKYLWDQQSPSSRELDPIALHLFNKLKVQNLHLADRTEEKNQYQRGHGIVAWLKKVRDIDAWVVLDDEVFADYEECGIIPHLVHTDEKCGLSDADVKSAIDILNRGN